MSFWQLVANSPEWIGVFANALFATVTIGVVTWQVCVMKWQGRNADRHERIQNRLTSLNRYESTFWIAGLQGGKLKTYVPSPRTPRVGSAGAAAEGITVVSKGPTVTRVYGFPKYVELPK